MAVLLDTHAILWILTADSRLSNTARECFENSDGLLFSMVSLWEIGIKLRLKRPDFKLDKHWWQLIPQSLVAQGVTRVDVEPTHCRDVALLPLHHRDPFDRMLIVQAQAADASILSADQQLDAYAVTRIW